MEKIYLGGEVGRYGRKAKEKILVWNTIRCVFDYYNFAYDRYVDLLV